MNNALKGSNVKNVKYQYISRDTTMKRAKKLVATLTDENGEQVFYFDETTTLETIQFHAYGYLIP